ncbi:MAG: hypothetical protein AB7V08_15180 [Elusimicrobiales bacterium]
MRSLLEGIGADLARYAQDRAAWVDRTGEARRGIRGGVATRRRGFTLFLEHTVWYARFLETGAVPHEVEADVKKALYWQGAVHPVKEVKHPGLRSRAVIIPTVDANIGKISRRIVDYWSD